MAEKYRLESEGHSQDGFIILDTSEGLKFHAEFREEKDAQEYIEFKNQPRIDVDIKQSIINSLIAKKDLRYKTKFTTVTKDLDIQIIDEAIEIISNLPTEEN